MFTILPVDYWGKNQYIPLFHLLVTLLSFECPNQFIRCVVIDDVYNYVTQV